MDKIRMKEELDFELKENPAITFFNALQRKIVAPVLSDAFSKIIKKGTESEVKHKHSRHPNGR